MARGPINRAVRIQDRASFTRVFGNPHPSSDLAASVGQFFNNGGSDCYIVRVAHNPETANIILRNLAGTSVLVATARDAGAWGNSLRIEIDYNTTNPDETFNLRVIQVDGDNNTVASEEHSALSMNPDSPRYAPDFVTLSSGLIGLALAGGFDPMAGPVVAGLSESRRPINSNPGGGQDFADMVNAVVFPGGALPPQCRFKISVNESAPVSVDLAPGGNFNGNQAAIAADIQNRIQNFLPAGTTVTVSWQAVHGDFRTLRITSNSNPRSSVRITRSNVNDFAGPMMIGLSHGGIEPTRFSAARPAPTGTVFTGDLNTLFGLTQDAFDRVTITGPNISAQQVGLGVTLQTTAAGDRWYRDASTNSITGNNDGVREKLRLIADAINNAPAPMIDGVRDYRAEVWGYHLALLPAVGNQNNFFELDTDRAAGGGTHIGVGGAPNLFTRNTRRYALGLTGTSPFQPGPGREGADDDGNPLDSGDYLGVQADATGFYALDTVDIFNLMVIPGDRDVDAQMPQILGPASVYCSEHRAMLLIDAPVGQGASSWTDLAAARPSIDANKVNDLRSLVVRQNSAVYYPRLVYADRGRRRRIGASGAVAGVFARTDSTRGVWKAPAGVEADVRGILDLEISLTDREQGILNKAGANALRKFPSGMVVWGARTLAGTDDDPSEWKYVPVRRFAMFLEESLYRGTKWVVFEPNDEPLWANIRKNLRAFMMGLFRQGAFEGTTPDLAFYVKCDSETTTAADRDLGIVNIEVGFAPLKPAEFVVIYIQQIAPPSD
ncbi:hypothetical protein A4X20_06145 [Mycolicibacterium iranicum]|uniref:Phage tail protein n=2 Tax=Mycolicibacterium iranicum TaxID=912594 RepID=A0A178LTM4_MYCIR|nr:hypothetical protein A4X20_06145 [Mycolicibacterium iranicum]